MSETSSSNCIEADTEEAFGNKKQKSARMTTFISYSLSFSLDN